MENQIFNHYREVQKKIADAKALLKNEGCDVQSLEAKVQWYEDFVDHVKNTDINLYNDAHRCADNTERK